MSITFTVKIKSVLFRWNKYVLVQGLLFEVDIHQFQRISLLPFPVHQKRAMNQIHKKKLIPLF
jgi:hypothetical protein